MNLFIKGPKHVENGQMNIKLPTSFALDANVNTKLFFAPKC
jgi:hypothetical protein